MPVTRELSITYAGLTFGGSTARQITGYTVDHAGWEDSAFEFEFVTSAATDAAFQAEIAAVRTAFRTPRGDLVVTQNGQNLISWKQSDNTGFDANPRIMKDGDPADTGRSRHFKVRIEFGQPADVIASVDFRRYSTVSISYSPERVRTVTITGVYTANSTDGTTSATAQYFSKITNYAAGICSGIDATATWEKIVEPEIEYNETNKVANFTIVFQEIIHNQALGQLDDTALVKPVMSIVKERWAPGDSFTGSFSFSGSSGSGARGNAGPQGNTTGGTTDVSQTMDPTRNPGQTTAGPGFERPFRILVTYDVGVNKDVTKNLTGKWTSTIRPFLISEAARVAGRGVTLLKEDPGFDDYQNRISATMEFISYSVGSLIEQEITTEDRTAFGKVLVPVTTPDVYDYYEFPGPAVRMRTCRIKYKQAVAGGDANAICDQLVTEIASAVGGLTSSAGWAPISNAPAVSVVKQGLFGGVIQEIAEVSIERVAQRRNRRTPSVANAGGITGAGLTG